MTTDPPTGQDGEVTDPWERGAIESLDVGVAVVRDGMVLRANPAAAELLGIPLERLVGMSLAEVLAGSDDEQGVPVSAEASVAGDVQRTGRSARRVRRVPQADGSDRWVLGTGRPSTYEGQPAAVVTLTDVTAEHEAQVRAEASEQRLQQILDAVDSSVFTKDREGRYAFVNRAFEQEVGRPAAEILGRTTAELAARIDRLAAAGAEADPPNASGAEEQDERLFATGGPVTDVLRRGSRAYLTTKRPLHDPSGRIDGLVGISTDIGDQLRAAESQAIANAVLESSSDGVVTFDRDLVITRINPAAALTHPSPAAELVGRAYFEVFDVGSLRAEVEGRLRATLAGATVEVEYSPALSDASRIFAVRAFPVRGADGEIVGGAVMARDITDARRAEETTRDLERQVEHMQRLEGLGQLAGGVAHDFNNLLGAIGLTAEMLTAQLPEGSDERTHAASIVAITRRASAFTQRLLVFARKDAARLQHVDVNAIARQADQLLARTLGEHVERRLDLVPGEVFVDADPASLEQVVLNLAINARDAMPDGGTLRIATTLADLTGPEHTTFRTRSPGRHVVLSVTDDGAGMDAETQRQAFDPFFTTKEPGQGTGLGLSAVYGVASQAGGGAWIYSEPGRGTVVKVALPVVSAPAHAASAAEEAPPEGAGQRVAVVEDEAALRDVARRILRRAAYEVETYPDGTALLEALDRGGDPPDLLLSDVVLPRLSGPELAQELLRRHPQVQVLFMSGYTAGLVDGGIERTDILDKPFTATTLLAAVSRALGTGTPAP